MQGIAVWTPLVSKKLDFLIFLGLLIFAGLVASISFFLDLAFMSTAFWFLLIKAPLDSAHIFATLFPTYLLISTKRLPATGLALIVGCALVGAVSIYFWSYQAFISILCYLLLIHLARQQYGWIMIARRKESRDKTPLWLDQIMIGNAFLYPILWWHSEYSYQFFLHANDFLFTTPKIILPALEALHWSINFFYIGTQFRQFRKGGVCNLTKLLIMFSTWITYYVGIVLLKRPDFFAISSVSTHALAYMCYSFKITRLNLTLYPKGIIHKFFATPMGSIRNFSFFVIASGFGLYSLFQLNLNGSLIMLAPLIWVPSLIHYFVDAVIWKRRFGLTQG